MRHKLRKGQRAMPENTLKLLFVALDLDEDDKLYTNDMRAFFERGYSKVHAPPQQLPAIADGIKPSPSRMAPVGPPVQAALLLQRVAPLRGAPLQAAPLRVAPGHQTLPTAPLVLEAPWLELKALPLQWARPRCLRRSLVAEE